MKRVVAVPPLRSIVRAAAGRHGRERVVAHEAWQQDPLGWMVEVLGEPRARLAWAEHPGYATHPWDGTIDPFVTVAQALVDWKDVGVESATTTGKTWFAARLGLWFLAAHPDALVVTVAPKAEQLLSQMWAELDGCWPAFKRAFPLAEKGKGIIRMRPGQDKWVMRAFVAGVRKEEVEASATRAQGFHAEHMLIVYEEMPGIAGAVRRAFTNTCRAPHNLQLGQGNPDHQLDELHRFCERAGTVHVRISAFDHPNIVLDDPAFIPGAVSRVGLAKAAEEHAPGTPMYESRVRGISPTQSSEAMIRLEWLERAAVRWEAWSASPGPERTLGRAMAVDAAQSQNGDMAAISRWQGAWCEEVVAFPCPDATVLGEEVAAEADRDGVLPHRIGVDPIGVGAATINALRRWSPMVQAIGFGESPVQRAQRSPDGATYEWATDGNRFQKLRGQVYWQLREDLRNDRIALPRDRLLWQELAAVTYDTRLGVVRVLPKDEIREQLGRSPDRADAVAIGNWVRPRQALPPPPDPTKDDLAQDTWEPDRDQGPAWGDVVANLPAGY